MADQRGRVIQGLRRLRRPAFLGTIRRTTPLSHFWGYDRGKPVDRYYIEEFLISCRQDIHGRVLEIRDNTYTQRFGSSVTQSDVLDIDSTNRHATIIADLAAAYSIPAGTFDCFILTQTLQLIYDTRAAIAHAHRILRPGGVLLVTVPTISRIVPQEEHGLETDYWRFTPAVCTRLFDEVFGTEQVTVRSHGNVLTAMAFLTGMACQELSSHELDRNDPFFPMIVTVRAVK